MTKKMVVMTIGLSLLLCVVVEVHSQTYPFLRFGNTGPALNNHSYLDLTAVGNSDDGSDSVQCVTDLNSCCHRVQGDDRGDWYFPNGTRLLLFNNLPIVSRDHIAQKRGPQQVELLCGNHEDLNGIYQCTIETEAVNDEDGRGIVYVGLYASGGEDMYILMHALYIHGCEKNFCHSTSHNNTSLVAIIDYQSNPFQTVWYSLCML